MESQECETPPPGSAAKAPGPLRQRIMWIAVIVIAAGVLLRFGVEYRKNSVEKGDALAKEVQTLSDRAKTAGDSNDIAAAKESLARAIMLLREADELKAHPVYISTLINMSALLLSRKTTGDSDVAEGRRLLTEAWEIARGLDAQTRWRIARDLGLGAVLAGDTIEAEKWYTIATELVPDDKVSRERLSALKSMKKWK